MKLFCKLRALLRKERLDAEMSAELQAHIDGLVERNLAAGMPPEEARYAALRAFGGVEQIKERCRDERRWLWLEELWRDVRLGLRALRKSPGFTAVAVLSLALGIGANTAVFSLVNAVLLQTLPVKEPHELVIFNWLSAGEYVGPASSSGTQTLEPGTRQRTGTSFTIPMFEAFRGHPETLDQVMAFAPVWNGATVSVDGAAEIVSGVQVVSGNYHLGLGVSAVAGRLLEPTDDSPAAEPVAVISYRYWQRRFGGDPAAIGKTITVNGVPATIIGVTAPAFNGAMQAGEVMDLTLPLSLESRINRSQGDNRRANYWWVRIMGRLKRGVTAEQARASLEGDFHANARGNLRAMALPGTPAVDPAKIPLPRLRVEPGARGMYESRRTYERSLRLLTGMVGLVLLVACANVGNLLLARGAARRREMALRLALGAGRGRLIRQLLVESVLLSALGAAVGIVFSIWGVQALLALQPFGTGALQFNTDLDWRVLGFTLAVALVVGVAFGLAPALRATRLSLTQEFQGGVSTLGAGSRSALTKTLMVVQVALSLVLLVGAGLFIRTLRNLQDTDVGFDRRQLLLFDVDAIANGAPAPKARLLYDRLRDRIAALPGVRHASFAHVAPLSDSNWNSQIIVPGYVPTTVGDMHVRMNGLGPDNLATMGIPVLRGRDFTAGDASDASSRVAVVNQSFARKYFGTEDVVGRRFRTSDRTAEPDVGVVGLVRDAHYSDVKSPPMPVVFFPYAQIQSIRAAHFVVRFSGSEAALMSAIRGAVREIDATLPVANVRTQEQQIDCLMTQERLFASLCSAFGGLALVLAAVGLHGMMAYAVQRRLREIGLRMALGALPRGVVWMIVRESMSLVVAGAVIGIAVALGVTRWIAGMLFGVPATDPFTYALVVLLLASVALAAAWLSARRAAHVDPLIALRAE